MQINNIALSTDCCRKPTRFLSFEAGKSAQKNKNKVRYKHYEEMSDDLVRTRSIIKAHQDAQNSNKMRLYKALPSIATGIIATSLALTQPGKLSAKAAQGLGFLAAMSGLGAIKDIITSKDNTERKKACATLGGLMAVGAGAVMMSRGKDKTGNINKVAEFLTKETQQLSNEINKTKLSKLSNKYIEPFLKKNPEASATIPILTIAASKVASIAASKGLLKGISKDISENACKNYEKAKQIQQIAREHFDSVDAIEV